jgi:hypothetical protein
MDEIANAGGLDHRNTDTILDFLQKYGDPRLTKLDSGWYCSLTLFATGTGVKFEVASDFRLGTPLIAAQQCLDRLTTTLSQIRGIT